MANNRNLEKPYALLQVHILFSFHTLIYILLIKHRKVRKIIGEFQRKSEKIRENRGISVENARKIGEFQWNPFLEVAEPKGDRAVVSGRFRSFFRSFLVMIPIDSEKSFRFIPNDSFSFHFITLSFHFHSSTPRFYALQHISCRFSKNSCSFPWRFQLFFVLLPTLNKMIVVYPAGRPFRLWLLSRRLFLCPRVSFC